jgi:fructose-1,6-bisphosphatase
MNEINAEGTYTVTFDPIDGSSVIDSNFSVASVYAVWETKDINGLTGRNLVGAALAIYGSRTTIILYNTQN